MEYSFLEHRHNFAVWTAARAVQRNFTITANIKYAIEASGLRQFVESQDCITQQDFDQLHRDWANKIIDELERRGVKEVKYGRAAKIISIYLKTAIIIPNEGKCTRSLLIHPPIDNILLTNIAEKEHLKDLGKEKWTTLDESEYWQLAAKIKSHLKRFDWTIEEHWKPEREKKSAQKKV